MKKFILILFLFFSFSGVRAMESSVRENGPFVFPDEEDSLYPLIDKELSIYTDESDLSPIFEKKEGRIINTYSGFEYKNAPALSYIEIEVGSSGACFGEFSFMYNGEDINYRVQENVSGVVLDPYQKIRFYFDEPIYSYNLIMDVDVLKYGNHNQLFDVSYGNENGIFFTSGYAVTPGEHFTLDGYHRFIDQSYFETIYSVTPLKRAWHTILIGSTTLYTYQDIKYQSYRLIESASDDEPTFDDSINVLKKKEDITLDGSTDLSLNSNPIKLKSGAFDGSFTDESFVQTKTPFNFDVNYKPLNYKNNVKQKQEINIFNYFILFIILLLFIIILIKMFKRKKA